MFRNAMPIVNLSSLEQTDAEWLLFKRLWPGVDALGSGVMLTRDAEDMVFEVYSRIVEGKTLDLDQDILRLVATSRDVSPSRRKELSHRVSPHLLRFVAFVGRFVHEYCRVVVPLDLAVEALIVSSDGFYGRVTSRGGQRIVTMNEHAAEFLHLTGTFDLTHEYGEAQAPSKII